MTTKHTPMLSNKICQSAQITIPQPKHIAELRTLWTEAFNDNDDFLDIFFSTAFSPERCLCVLVEGKVAAALYWFECEYQKQPLAYIYAVATAKVYRGQGLCHILLDATHSKLKKQGYIGALLVPGSHTLFDFYKKIGYQTTCYRHTIKYDLNTTTKNSYPIDQLSNTTSLVAASIFSITQISAHEYAALRKKFLPENSVIQEKENLSFLQTQLRFYWGEGFLFATHINKQTIYGAELLYENCCNTTVLSSENTIQNNLFLKKLMHDLLTYFDCNTGIFCTPGAGTAFAMYFPLDNRILSAPSYFAFAFD